MAKETQITVTDAKGRVVRRAWSFDEKKAQKSADEAMKRGYQQSKKQREW